MPQDQRISNQIFKYLFYINFYARDGVGQFCFVKNLFSVAR